MNVLVITPRRYNKRELWMSLGILQNRGHVSKVASTAYSIEDEATGQRSTIKLLVSDIKAIDEYDALMVVSGNPQDTEAYWSMPEVQRIVKQFRESDKPIAAICYSVPTIRQAAQGKKVSCFPLLTAVRALEAAGAILSPVSMSVDGSLVTAENEMFCEMWAETFCDILEGKEPSILLRDSGFVAGVRERKPMPELEHLRSVVRSTGKTHIKKEYK